MKHWFARLPIHRKLVVMALVVTTAALLLAMLGLVGLDLWRYRTTALDDARSLAEVIAENSAAAVTFRDADVALKTLDTVRVRPAVRRACLYEQNRSLFAGFGRSEEFSCPSTQPSTVPWTVVVGRAPVRSNQRLIGTAYVERDLAEIWTRIAVTGFTGMGMLLVAGTVALLLAHRLHRSVSAPITQLASAARSIGREGMVESLPAVQAGDDEIGDLVRAFTEMLRRVHDANARLLETNEVLRRQEAEREGLLFREREASRLKDEFLAAVSHELRTPLNAIVGWVQILTTTTTDEPTTAKAIASIARNAKAQTRVIEDLVDVSRIITGKLNLRFDPVDLCDVVESAIDVVRSGAQAKTIRLQIEVPHDACLVNGDRDRLQQVIWNLLSNAIKFTPPRGTVSLKLKRDDDVFVLEVSDTGVGIPGSFLPHVFERFRQADGSTTREHGGLGLGLAIVKELTELHGGEVAAASGGEGQGATFVVRLPQLAGLDLPVRREARGSRGTSTALRGIHILAVDDNRDALDVLAVSLASRGADVRVVASGQEALREWDRDPPDVLLCDLAMPHMNGFDLLSIIRERDRARNRVTPAIAVTAHTSEEYQARTREAGFDFHVAKPYDVAQLVRTVLTALERAS